MSRILENIWNTLSSDGKTTSDFNTWQSNFFENPNVQVNVYNYLKENNYTQSDPKVWVNNINQDIEASKKEQDNEEEIDELKTGIQSYDVKQDAMAYAASTNVSTFFDRIFEEESDKGIQKVKETDKKQPSYYGFKANLQALGMGDNIVTDFAAENISEMYRSLFEIGGSQAKSTVAGWNVMNNEQFSTDEDFIALIDAANNMPEQTDAVKKYSSRYEQIKEKDGGVMAFMVGVAENPKYIRDVALSSLGNMVASFATSPDVAGRALVGGIGGVATSKLPGISKALGFLSGFMGSVSGSMDAAQTYSQLMQEQLTKEGKEFTPENIKSLLQNKEVISFKDPNGNTALDMVGTRADILKRRSIRRGIAIGLVDGFSTLLAGRTAGGAVGKISTSTKRNLKATAQAMGGGIASEIAGQTFGGQEYEAGEILTEGIAEKGIATTGVTVLPKLLKKQGIYKIGKQQFSEKRFVEEINKMDDATLAAANVKVENDQSLDGLVKRRQGDAYIDSQINPKVSDPNDRKILIEKEKELAKAKADAAKKDAYAVPGADQKVKAIQDEIAIIINKYSGVDGRTSEVRARAKAGKEIKKARVKIYLKDTEQFAEISSEQLDYDPYEAFDTNKEYVGAYVSRVMAGMDLSNMTQEQIETEANRLAKQANNSDGVNVVRDADGRGKIMINREIAAEYGAMNVGSHEVLHAVMEGALRQMKPAERKIVIKEFKGQIATNLGQDVLDLIDTRLRTAYAKKDDKGNIIPGETTIDLSETSEWFTALSDVIQDEKNNITYKDNKSFFDKIKDNIAFGIFREKTPYKKLSIETGEQAFNFMKEYSKSVKAGRLSESMVEFAGRDKTAAGSSFSKTASDKVQSIYEEKGARGAFEIIEEFKPIVSRIADKRREAPNFDKELLMSEIEIGPRGILDLIRDYKIESGVPLAAYINKFLPARAIEASRRVLGEEFTQDVTEAKGVAAEEVKDVEVQTKPKKKKIVLADRLRVENKVDKAIANIFSKLNLDKLNFKTLKDLTPKITGEMFGISPKKLTSLANITKKELQSAQMFINKNADLLIAMMPEGTTASGTATGVPNSLLKAFYTKSERAKAAKTGSRSGLAVQVKNDISKKEFLEVFGIIDGKPDRTDRNTSARVLALANLTGKMMTNQAVRKILVADQSNPSHVLGVLEDGKSEVMFSKSEIKDLKTLQNKAIKKTVDPGRSVNAILKDSWGFEPINMNTDKGRKEYVAKVYPILGKYLPKSFFLWAGNFTGTTKKVIDVSEGIAQEKRVPAKNLPYVNTTETKNAVKSAEQVYGKNIFAEPDIDIENALKRLSYKDIAKKLLNGTYVEFNESKSRGMKKIWQAFEASVKEDPANARLIAALLSSTSSQQRHFMRTMSPIRFFNLLNLANVEEHTEPATFFGNYLFTRLLEGTLFDKNKKYYDNALKSYFQGSLPDVYDKKLRGTRPDGTQYDYTSKLPKKYSIDVLLGKIPVWIRYINEDVNNNNGGIDPNVIKLDNGKTLAQEYGVDVAAKKTTPAVIKQQQRLLFEIFTGQTTEKNAKKFINEFAKVEINKNIDQIDTFSKSISASRSIGKTKGITILDFDDTLATSKSLIRYTTPEGTKGTLTPEQYASTYEDLLGLGYKFDFSEFNEVIDGKIAPLFNKAKKLDSKFGTKDMFVLTARPSESAPAIQAFLKSQGLDIPIQNITGLANSTSEAKALWVAEKVGEGYNDFYFADDALQNVQAVKNMLDQFDVKSKVQQAKVNFSNTINEDFNNILQDVTGIKSEKRFAATKARKRGADKGKFRLFIPPSHEDFVGLLYNFMGKGRKGDAHRKFFEQALVRPLNRAHREIDAAKQAVANDYKALNKQMPDVRKKLIKKTPDGDFTFQDAIRVYLWDKHGYKIPGLSEVDQASLVDIVKQDPSLQAYAEALNIISKQETYVDPGPNWETGNIRIDLVDATGRVGRTSYFAEFNENADIIFSEENLNKIEAAYGKPFREALEDMLYRIKTGINRPKGSSAKPNIFMNWLNASVSGVMFFNTRSSVLQQLSNVNYLNFADNNIFAAAMAFANQKQYWKDFAMIFNSDMLKQRRGGLQTDINGAELAEAIKKARPNNLFDQVAVIVGKALKIGFLPTQIGDNIAIATGGATFYRNRVNKYIKEGLSQKEAEAKAFNDFQEITQSTQQSAKPYMTSQQQAMWIGKLVLNFLNTPSQYNRIIKKAGSDLINRRITPPNTTQVQSDMSNMSRILYYGAIQNLIFYSLQTALFAVMFGTDDEDEDKRVEAYLSKKQRVIQGTIDTILRGSGIYGVAVSTLKNMTIKFLEQREAGYNKDESAVIMEMLNFSPVVGIKARRIVNAEKTLNYNKKVIEQMETFDIDNPMWSAVTNYTQTITTAPTNKLYQKTINLRNASDNQYTAMQRLMFLIGYSTWNLNLGDTEKMKEIKAKTKVKKRGKERGKERGKLRN